LVLGSCETVDSTDLGRSAGANPANMTQTASASADRAAALASLADSLFEMEKSAAGVAFGDPSGEGEGEEDMIHTVFLSSLRVAEIALQLDSSSTAARFVLGKVYAERSYRGFGLFNREDLQDARLHLEAAEAGVPKEDIRKQQAQALLRVVNHNLRSENAARPR
jgi:hypothetical protein